MHRHEVSPQEFVRVWQGASSLQEVAERTGLHENAARVRAFRYRKRGIPLKQLSVPSRRAVDVAELTRLAREVAC